MCRRLSRRLWAALLMVFALVGCAEARKSPDPVPPPPTSPPELALLFVGHERCPICQLFERQVAPGYANTAEGRRAPLVRLTFGEDFPPPYEWVTPAVVMPSFILVADGEEVGRIEGYTSDELFWMQLTRLLQDAEARHASNVSTIPGRVSEGPGEGPRPSALEPRSSAVNGGAVTP